MPVVVTVPISPSERVRGRMSPSTLAAALAAFRRDGIVVLGGAIARGSVQALAQRMEQDMRSFSVNDGDYDFGAQNTAIGIEGGHGEAGRKPQDFRGIRPPPFHPHLRSDIVYNEPAVAVSAALLGPQPTLVTYAANASWPGSAPQGVHADATFPRDASHTTTGRVPALVVNVPLDDFTLDNGATRVYPGTHLNRAPTLTTRALGEHGPTGVPPEECARRERVCPSEQPCPRRGDLVLRDLRLWHGGMPNHTSSPRSMLVMVHIAADYRGPREPTFFTGFEAEMGSEDFFCHPVLHTSVAFLPRPLRYQSGGHSAPETRLKSTLAERRARGELYLWADAEDPHTANQQQKLDPIGTNAALVPKL
jgi:ectoine hydroxylase-related dioxygenase (phytanoyl-CoA dioxygenase family)